MTVSSARYTRAQVKLSSLSNCIRNSGNFNKPKVKLTSFSGKKCKTSIPQRSSSSATITGIINSLSPNVKEISVWPYTCNGSPSADFNSVDTFCKNWSHRSKLYKTFFDIYETAAPVSTNICIQNNFIDAFANQQEPVWDNSRMLPCDRIGDLVNTSGTELPVSRTFRCWPYKVNN